MSEFQILCQMTYIRYLLLAVNECEEKTDNCHVNAYCTDLGVGFSCACKEGFSGDGVTCAGFNSFI